MNVVFRVVGKTSEKYLEEGIAVFNKRLSHYLPYKYEIMPDVKKAGKMSPVQLKEEEGKMILQKTNSDDYLILLDENGKSFTSKDFSKHLEKLLQQPYKRIIFQVGGAFGFSPEVYKRANAKLSLSEMTFSHQMIRLFFTEQLYRTMTIIRNEKYHNE
ncbi:MAG: 23S rRNA (pseudouridine(1915)-N(3))-methyltransferase RlmH [Bacteroidetes bacterium]|nr:MAG: 23S rRNA (pseudouridine(1915)-N(3))-methyltransferase RlmH [Bacteroidota bacterium]